jgi:hypothetical protein
MKGETAIPCPKFEFKMLGQEDGSWLGLGSPDQTEGSVSAMIDTADSNGTEVTKDELDALVSKLTSRIDEKKVWQNHNFVFFARKNIAGVMLCQG